MDEGIRGLLSGAIVMASSVVGLLFLRSWRRSRDRLFAIFALAFWMLALHWLGLAIAQPTDETRHYFYVFRLVAFLLIIWAIVDKNRAGGSDRRG
jgi:hypothetical protein